MRICACNAKTMSEIEWHPKAEAEFRGAARHYERHQKGLGERFGQTVTMAIANAAKDPGRYQWIDEHCQIVRTKKFPYSVIYEVREELIRIVAIMHQHRRPGYWKERAENWPE